MITASKSAFWDSVMHSYFRWLFRKQFHSLLLAGKENVRALEEKRPALGVANHSNWWDGFVILFLTRLLAHRQHYIMMEERQLVKYPFFRKLGAFGVNLDNAREAASSLRYALRLLEDDRTMLWIFPQARMAPSRSEMEFRGGAGVLARRTKGCAVLPLALRYEFTTEQRPVVLARFGAVSVEPAVVSERCVGELLGRIDRDVLDQRFAEYEVFIPPRMSLNKKWEFFWHLVQGKLSDFRRENHYRP